MHLTTQGRSRPAMGRLVCGAVAGAPLLLAATLGLAGCVDVAVAADVPAAPAVAPQTVNVIVINFDPVSEDARRTSSCTST